MKTKYVYPSTEIETIDCGVMDMTQKVYHKGMTLRDYFANSAMQGMLSNPSMFDVLNGNASEIASKLSYQLADAMLKQSEIENL